MHKRAFLVATYVYLACWVRAIAIYAKGHQHDAARYLQEEAVVGVGYQVHHEAHAEARYKRINKVADCCSYSSYKAIPPPFVEGSLYAENSNGTHWRRSHYAYEDAFEYPVEYV